MWKFSQQQSVLIIILFCQWFEDAYFDGDLNLFCWLHSKHPFSTMIKIRDTKHELVQAIIYLNVYKPLFTIKTYLITIEYWFIIETSWIILKNRKKWNVLYLSNSSIFNYWWNFIFNNLNCIFCKLKLNKCPQNSHFVSVFFFHFNRR